MLVNFGGDRCMVRCFCLGISPRKPHLPFWRWNVVFTLSWVPPMSLSICLQYPSTSFPFSSARVKISENLAINICYFNSYTNLYQAKPKDIRTIHFEFFIDFTKVSLSRIAPTKLPSKDGIEELKIKFPFI